MNEFDVPILQKAYELYKLFHGYRNTVPKQDRYTTFERCENLMLDVIETITIASQEQKANKTPALERCSARLNVLRILIRLLKDTKAIDMKKYVALQCFIDEIGRMLGGWIKSVRIS